MLMDSPEVNYTHLNISNGYWQNSPTTLDFNSAHYDGQDSFCRDGPASGSGQNGCK
eukprot:CAMPEP_0180117188 /NCGR_PEP_ID=MMETSP0986-20121125/788_1 /TAXON_ID=697907 /ORGANISM="non described non described, Strain CCMP2293" /LENGTH=55 /DNA_ID=CAMNT_0022056051 /DNA_START=54 /DNA_END=221 /DNA_ORIENTATION=+